MVDGQGFSLKDRTASTRNLARFKRAYTSFLATLASRSSGSGVEGTAKEGLIAGTGLEVAPKSPEHDWQYVLVDQMHNRRKVAKKNRGIFLLFNRD